MADELLDITQAAEFLRVSETSLRRWTNEGRLACLRVGRRRERRFRRNDLMLFMESQPAEVERAISPVRAEFRHHMPIDGLPVALGTHLCGFHEGDAAAAKLGVPFLASGLRPGTACFLLGDEAFRQSIVGGLRRLPTWPEKYAGEGGLVEGDYADSAEAQLERLARLLDDALAAGASAARVLGSTSSFHRKAGAGELRAYEAGFDAQISRRYPVVTLCLYDAVYFSGGDTIAALKLHQDSFAYPPERWLA